MSNSFIDRIDDWCKLALRNSRLITSHFLDEGQLSVVQGYLNKKMNYTVNGGHDAAKRKVVGFNGDAAKAIVCLAAKYRNAFVTITHRDVYGALMNLKISPEMLGDIYVLDDLICIYAMKLIEKDIVMNLTQISRLQVQFEKSDQPYYKPAEFKVFHCSVASLRLDNICSAMTNSSRSNAKDLILQKQVKVNHQIVEDLSVICHNGDTISIHRYGRFIFCETLKTTKKDRLLIEYKQYI